MKETVINREILLEIVRTNRRKHQLDYTTMVERYRSSLYSTLMAGIEDLQGGDKSKPLQVKLPEVPHCFLDQYDQAIRALELDTRPEITLMDSEFGKLVLDQWVWQGQFTHTKTLYGLGV